MAQAPWAAEVVISRDPSMSMGVMTALFLQVEAWVMVSEVTSSVSARPVGEGVSIEMGLEVTLMTKGAGVGASLPGLGAGVTKAGLPFGAVGASTGVGASVSSIWVGSQVGFCW